MVSDLGGQGKRKPNCLRGGVPRPAAERREGAGIEARRLVESRGAAAGLNQRKGHTLTEEAVRA